MKNKMSILILVMLSSQLIGCKSNSNKDLLKTEINVQLDASLNSEKSYYDLKFQYDDNYFLSDANNYDKNLSLLSFGCSLISKSAQTGNAFFDKAAFIDIEAKNYQQSDKDGCAYMLAHKNIQDYEVVAIAFRGFDYNVEWANNLEIGETGDHEGFTKSLNGVYVELQNYISNHCNNKTLKLWINGYSRGGALSNLLASTIISEKKIQVAQSDMFVYTFEAPRGVSKENAKKYENVHNIVNSCDLITNIAPEKYELYRCGVDVEIYDSDVASALKKLDKDISIPDFTPSEYYNNDKQLVNFIINAIVNNTSVEDDCSMKDRIHFYNNYQSGISYMVGKLFSLKGTTRSALVNSIKSMGSSAVTLFSDKTGSNLASFLQTYLNNDNISYDNADLLSSCAVTCKAFTSIGQPLLSLFSSSNLTRMLDMHYPEVAYSLLLNSHQ